MITYPSFDANIIKSRDCYFYDKLDGQHVRAEFSMKRGFYKFGSKEVLIGPDIDNPFLKQAPELFLTKYADEIMRVAVKNRLDRGTAVVELFGPNTFAGIHQPDDQLDVVLIDFHAYGLGWLPPKRFERWFKDLHKARLLHIGKASVPFIESVQNGTLEGMTFEGVVGKCPHSAKSDYNLMFKIKNHAWYSRLREFAKDGSLPKTMRNS